MLSGLPNLLTLSRILVIPIFLAAFALPGPAANWLAFGLFVAASLTDWLDGFLARRLGQTSEFGRFLDPVADKLLVAAALVMLVADGRAPALAALIILCREILISSLREFLAREALKLPVTMLAKIKTASQMTALCVLLVGEAAPGVGLSAGLVLDGGAWLLWLAAVLSVASGWGYVRHGVRLMLAADRNDKGVVDS
jgi:cardiolipin synthase